jgi:hypothetical protein
MLRAHGRAGAAAGQEPECCERMDAQEQLLGRSPNAASAWTRRSSCWAEEPECCERMDAQEQPPCQRSQAAISPLSVFDRYSTERLLVRSAALRHDELPHSRSAP